MLCFISGVVGTFFLLLFLFFIFLYFFIFFMPGRVDVNEAKNHFGGLPPGALATITRALRCVFIVRL